MQVQVLDEATWRARAAAHETRVDALVADHLARRADGVKHPVHDFLFTYYSHRPAQLRRWHPGFGVGLLDAPSYAELPTYGRIVPNDSGVNWPPNSPGRSGLSPQVVAVRGEVLAQRRRLVRQLLGLMEATAARPPGFGCFGLHEWAMVHGAEEIRHPWPLRLGRAGTDAVVEGHKIACSHFDAYRFFTSSARPLNALSPGRDDRADFEQPGCLHATMDLYKHAFRLSPLVPGELVADCFELARDVRELDMRAAPYDLSDLGYEPVPIETPEGKHEYVTAQRRFAERARPLRDRLIMACRELTAVTTPRR